MKKMLVFDADGVLLNNQLGGFKELLIELGREKEVREIDEEYQRRRERGPWGLAELARLFNGIKVDDIEILAQNYCKEKLMAGAVTLVSELKQKGFVLGILSSNPQILLDQLKGILSLDFVEGTRLTDKNGTLTGGIEIKVDRFVKANFLKNKMREFGIEKKDLIVVGDSITDLPMAELAGKFIVFNCMDEKVRQKGDAVIDKKNLQEILYEIN